MSDQLLHRIDERTNTLNTKVNEIKGELHDLRTVIDAKYVTREEFLPVRNIIYGLVGMILMGVLGALTAAVLHSPHP